MHAQLRASPGVILVASYYKSTSLWVEICELSAIFLIKEVKTLKHAGETYMCLSLHSILLFNIFLFLQPFNF